MRVYIQKWGNEIPNDNIFTAFLGANQKGSGDTIHFFEDINKVPIGRDKDNHPPLVVGFIEDTIEYFKRCGIETPQQLNIPEELNKDVYLGRKIEIKTLGEFKKDIKLPIFVKPHSIIKAFKNGVFKEESSRKIFFNKDDFGNILDDNMLVLTSEVVDMISEYRCFVKEGKLMDIRHYQGDCRVFPDIERIEDMIEAYKSAPKAYSLDVAIINRTSNLLDKTLGYIKEPAKKPVFQSTVLIECQDMWSIGPYGLDPETYLNMLKRRWMEIFLDQTKKLVKEFGDKLEKTSKKNENRN